MSLSADDFVVSADGTRLWKDPNKCPHSNDSACATCDFDRYYARKYPTAPWRDKSR